MKTIKYIFSKYYTSNFETKDFNVSIDGKGFLDSPIKGIKRLLKQEEIMTTQHIIYQTINIFQSITN